MIDSIRIGWFFYEWMWRHPDNSGSALLHQDDASLIWSMTNTMVKTVLPNPRFRRPIGLLLTSAPRLSKPYRYFATFVLLLTYLPRNVLEIGRLCEKLSISCQFRRILNFFNVNEQINYKLIRLRRHIEPSKSFESDYPQLPEVGQSIVFPPNWVICGLFDT